MRTQKSSFARFFGTFSRRKPAQKQPRPRRFEQLEQRKLLSVTVAGTATVTYGSGQDGPIPAAYVTIRFTGTDNQPHTLAPPATSVNGSFSATSAFTPLANTKITITLQAGRTGTNHSQYWVDNPSNNNNVWMASFTSKPLPPDQNQVSTTLAYALNVDASNYSLNKAFQIYSTVQNVYALYATQQLGATLSDPLRIDYPMAAATQNSDFIVSNGVPALELTSLGMQQPDFLGHEFGHYVAYEAGFSGGPGGAHEVGYNMRFFNDARQPNPASSLGDLTTLSTNEQILAFEEGWADYFDVAAKKWYKGTPAGQSLLAFIDPTPGNDFDFNVSSSAGVGWISLGDDAGQYPGRGEDDEGSVARILWDLANNGQYGMTNATLFQAIRSALANTIPNPQYPWLRIPNPTKPTLAALTRALGLFSTMASVQTYAPNYEAYNVSPTTVAYGYDGTGKPCFQFQLPVLKNNGLATLQNLDNLTRLMTLDTIALSFVVNQNDPVTAAVVTIPVSFSNNPNLVPQGFAKGGSELTCFYYMPANQWQSVVTSLQLLHPGWTWSNGVYWAVLGSATLAAGGGPYSGVYKLAQVNGMAVTSFDAYGTSNKLALTYNILPSSSGWPVTIPFFVVNVYAVADGSFLDARNIYNLIASYPVNDSNYPDDFTGTADNNQFTLDLPTDDVSSSLLGAPNQYLIAEIDFDGDPSGDLPVLARFQGGAFQTGDSQLWVYGGESLDQDLPESNLYTNTMTMISASGGVTVAGTVFGSDSNITYSQTFTTTGGRVNVYDHDGDSTVDGSGITNSAIWISALGGAGNDVFQGGAGNDWFYGRGGNNTFYSSPGSDNFCGGSDSNLFVFSQSFSSYCSISDLPGANDTILLELPANSPLPEVIDTAITLADGGHILYASIEDAILIGDQDNLTLASGGNVTLPSLPLDTNLDLENGTVLVLNGGAVSLGAVTLSDGSMFDLGGQSDTFGAVTLNDGSITDGAITATSYTVYSGSLDVDLAGGPLTMSGTGVVDLSGNNTYTGGTAVDNGTLEAQTPGSLPGYDSCGVVSVATGATLAVAVGGTDDWQSADIDSLLANVQFSTGSALGIDTSDGDFVYGSNITNVTGVPLGLVKLGDNMLTLTGTNTYTGGTQVDAGTLEAETTGSLPGYDSAGVVCVGNGATLAVVVGGTGEWLSTNIDTILGDVAFGNGSAIGIDTSGGDFTYGTSITDTVGGPLGFVKLGGNTLTLSGDNTFSGGTEVIAGTLTVQNYSLPTGGSINVASGATLYYDTTAGDIEQQPTTFTGGGTLLVDGGSSLMFDGAGSGDVNVSFSPGALIDVAAGTLAGSSDASGQWANNCASLNVAAGATFDGGDGAIFVDALTGDGIFEGGAGVGPITETIGVADGSGSFSGVIQDNNYGPLAILKTGAGTQILYGDNTYTGGTAIVSGTLAINSDGALGCRIRLPGPLGRAGCNTAAAVPNLHFSPYFFSARSRFSRRSRSNNSSSLIPASQP